MGAAGLLSGVGDVVADVSTRQMWLGMGLIVAAQVSHRQPGNAGSRCNMRYVTASPNGWYEDRTHATSPPYHVLCDNSSLSGYLQS